MTSTTTSPSDLDAAKRAAYQQGYRAGTRVRPKSGAEKLRRHLKSQERAFWERALLAALPYAVEHAPAWRKSETRQAAIDDRMELAADFADAAVKRWKERF